MLIGACSVLMALLVVAWRMRRRREAYELDPLPPEMEKLAPVPIRQVTDNRRVKIVGKLRFVGAPLPAPLSGRPCAFCDVRASDDNGVIVASESEGCDFYVDDGTGRAIICVSVARVFVKLDARYRSHGRQVTSRQAAFLERHHQTPAGPLRYIEGTLTSGETVTVVGVPFHEPDLDQRNLDTLRDMPMCLRFEGADLFVTDDWSATL